MKSAAKIIAPLALAASIIPPVLFAFGLLGDGPMKLVMLIAALAWFASAPFWLKGGER